tara:strand:+ start:4091 stop:4930 length:840 start_codon:yes stop_codon:yes gene_type:complete
MKRFSLLLFISIAFLNFSQNTYIPDDNFEQSLIEYGYDDVMDDSVLTANIDEVLSILLLNESISDLTGIAGFTSLTWLNCSSNQLSNLDLSQNTALAFLQCYGNPLNSLDVSLNSDLQSLNCSNTGLTSLNLSQNMELRYLQCKDNFLTVLDLSNNIELNHLDCKNNQLTCLNVKNGNNSNIGPTQMITYLNPELTCIEVDSPSYSSGNWGNSDPQASFSVHCNNDCSSPTVGMIDITSSKKLVRILDMMGGETIFKPNTPLIYVYDDGSSKIICRIEG